MRYLAIATDYDGTLAEHGVVSPETLAALKRLRDSGRRLILVTGRELPDLLRVFPEYALFDRIVAENGALLFCPETREERVLGEPPPAALLQRLSAADVQFSVGRVIVATWSPNEKAVLDAIHLLGLELQVIFNKGAVMVLPSGINKASGLRVALADLSLSPHNVVSIGDAENDHALLAECELGVAVANALPMLKERADWVTEGERGAGVRELIEELAVSDLRERQGRLGRRDIVIGTRADGAEVRIPPYGRRVLLCGTSGSGKSTLATAFLERLFEERYQFCLVDPEGDFGNLSDALVLGDEDHEPKVEDVIGVLRSVDTSVIASLLAVPLEQRAGFLTSLVARSSELRAQTGRPHWFVIDEAHHMLPDGDTAVPDPIAHAPSGIMLITVHPDKLSRSVLQQIDTLIVIGQEPREMLTSFAKIVTAKVPEWPSAPLEAGEAVIWSWHTQEPPQLFRAATPKTERHRHRRKYAAGALGEDKSFYFKGPEDRLNLRAQNIMMFLQIGDGVDDETWLHHLQAHHYSQWVKTAIKNDELAREIETIESTTLDPNLSRKQIRQAMEKIYTLPA